MAKRILLTGGAGFIGSHTYVALMSAGHEVIILDNFENARRDVPDRLAEITGRSVPVIEADIRDGDAIHDALLQGGFDAVVHFAARKSVAEGEADPMSYYRVNCAGLMNVVEAMAAAEVRRFVFSSSAAVYGNAKTVPITEETPVAPESTYGRTKVVGEDYLLAVARADPRFAVGILRYFNPVGAHASGLIGEDPAQPPTNLAAVIARVARGDMEKLQIFGDDYPTPDGTGIRDYIHVEDLARGHVLSLERLFKDGAGHLVNLGTGRGHSVREVLGTYCDVLGYDLAHEVVDRRPGDPAVSFANVDLARTVLGFEATRGLREMCESNWAFAGQLSR